MFSDSYHNLRAPRPWTFAVQFPSTVVHVVAILITMLRLLYRWHLSRFAWEDGWATLALICDIMCLASVWVAVAPRVPHQMPKRNHESLWLLSLAVTSVLWFARMSILSSVVRIANPTPKLRIVAYCIGAIFLAMYAGLMAQKVFICMTQNCWFSIPVAIAQLVTDVISDTILVIMPIRFLRDVRLHRGRRILIISAFSASLLITAVTILHSALSFQHVTNVTFVIGHAKAALSLLVCNALVFVTFVYRLCQKPGLDPECSTGQGSGTGRNAAEFTSVIYLPSKSSSGVHPVEFEMQGRGDGDCVNSAPTPDT